MKTYHNIIYSDSREMKEVKSNSVDLIITSPPYPMIEMWDETFSQLNPEIGEALKNYDGNTAFELMHKQLDKVWKEVFRVLKIGGIACINIGEATRTLNKKFQLYPNHSRILNYAMTLGFKPMPYILWIKESNKPNKFMGSGMLPVGAYVTLEHEYILVLRKGDKREFKTSEEKLNREKSAFFWEERNIWFSEKWADINGASQKLNQNKLRERSAAYPFELPYRLINMFSVQGDTVLDPFFGTGTTTLASMASGRHSIGYEIDVNFKEIIEQRIKDIKKMANKYIEDRLKKHIEFMKKRKEIKYLNKIYNFPVVTLHETNIYIPIIKNVKKINDNLFEVEYQSETEYHSNSLISTTIPSFSFS